MATFYSYSRLYFLMFFILFTMSFNDFFCFPLIFLRFCFFSFLAKCSYSPTNLNMPVVWQSATRAVKTHHPKFTLYYAINTTNKSVFSANGSGHRHLFVCSNRYFSHARPALTRRNYTKPNILPWFSRSKFSLYT